LFPVCSTRRFYGKVFARIDSQSGNREMPAVARKFEPQPSRKTFHATALVTRLEEWWVEAESAEEAKALLVAGDGHHAGLGERVHVELEGVLEEAG
jgi:hypothetical protein